MDNPVLPLRVGCCSVTDFRPRDASSNAVGHWEATKLADSTHLTEGVSKDWGFEDAVIVDGKVRLHHYITGLLQHADYFSRW